MCNLYSIVRPRDEMARAFRVLIDRTANQPPLPAVFPDRLAPIVRINSASERMIESMRWGFPVGASSHVSQSVRVPSPIRAIPASHG
jgi:putative SOS response-associated peptidase YedK